MLRMESRWPERFTTGAELRTALDEIPKSDWTPARRDLDRSLEKLMSVGADDWEIEVFANVEDPGGGVIPYVAVAGPPVGATGLHVATGQSVNEAMRSLAAKY